MGSERVLTVEQVNERCAELKSLAIIKGFRQNRIALQELCDSHESIRAELAQARFETRTFQKQIELFRDSVTPESRNVMFETLRCISNHVNTPTSKLTVAIVTHDALKEYHAENERAEQAEARVAVLEGRIAETVKYMESLNDNLPVLRHVKTQVLARLQPTGGQTP